MNNNQAIGQLSGDKMTKTCSQHGEFISSGRFYFKNRIIWSVCPVCLQNKKDEENRDDISLGLKAGGISPRFLNATFDAYEPRNESQATAKMVFSRFNANFTSMDAGTGLILTGDTGSGKTHLASALVHSLIQRHQSARIITAVDLIRTIREAYNKRSQNEKSIIQYFIDLDLLVIDEVGIQMGSQSELLLMFDVIDGRYGEMKSTVLLSNMDPEPLAEFITPRLYRRVTGDKGITLTMQWSDK